MLVFTSVLCGHPDCREVSGSEKVARFPFICELTSEKLNEHKTTIAQRFKNTETKPVDFGV